MVQENRVQTVTLDVLRLETVSLQINYLEEAMPKLLFIGDIVGDPGLEYLETHLPKILEIHQPDFVIANAENLSLNNAGRGPCGMTQASLERLFALGVQLVTGGNHSWDGLEVEAVHNDPRVIRPLNVGPNWPGRGASIVISNHFRLGVVNLAGRSAIPGVDQPFPVLELQLEAWKDAVDAVIVDFHGESVYEKITLAHAFVGQIAGLLGTHTHVPTLDTQILEGGVAYVSDVGMTGPSGGAQGYKPQGFIANMRSQGFAQSILEHAGGPVELGVVLVTLEGSRAVEIKRVFGANEVGNDQIESKQPQLLEIA
jgi:2',3'-cyclic-nucleotide 2'-phosphodiesterase